MGRHLIAPAVVCALVIGTGGAAGQGEKAKHPIIAGALISLAGLLSIGLSGGQVIRCLRRQSSDDVTILGWLSGAASNLCVMIVALITDSSGWLVFWQGLGVIEYATPAAIAWWFRSSQPAPAAPTPPAPNEPRA